MVMVRQKCFFSTEGQDIDLIRPVFMQLTAIPLFFLFNIVYLCMATNRVIVPDFQGRKVRTEKSIAPANGRVALRRQQTVPQKITVALRRDEGENVR